MDYDLARANERFKGWGLLGDNAGLLLFAGSVAKFIDPQTRGSLSAFLIVLGVALGIAFFGAAWHIRGYIQPED